MDDNFAYQIRIQRLWGTNSQGRKSTKYADNKNKALVFTGASSMEFVALTALTDAKNFNLGIKKFDLFLERYSRQNINSDMGGIAAENQLHTGWKFLLRHACN